MFAWVSTGLVGGGGGGGREEKGRKGRTLDLVARLVEVVEGVSLMTLSWRLRGVARGGAVSGRQRMMGREVRRMGVLILKGSQRSRERSHDPPAAETMSVTLIKAPTR